MALTDVKDGVIELEKGVLPDVLARMDKLLALGERLEKLLPSVLDGYEITINIVKKETK